MLFALNYFGPLNTVISSFLIYFRQHTSRAHSFAKTSSQRKQSKFAENFLKKKLKKTSLFDPMLEVLQYRPNYQTCITVSVILYAPISIFIYGKLGRQSLFLGYENRVVRTRLMIDFFSKIVRKIYSLS